MTTLTTDQQDAPAPGNEPPIFEETLDELSDLDALLEESMQSERAKAEAKAARERLKRSGLSATERIEDEARIAAWEAANEWENVANVGQFRRFNCACGQHYTVFEQLMVRQRHRHLRDSSRWQQQSAGSLTLPNETVLRHTAIASCEACIATKGWDLSNATEWRI